MTYHTPVLLRESVEGLNVRPDGIYADVTFGGGGHSREILKRLVTGRLVAMDQDKDALANAPKDERLILERGNFRFLQNFMVHNGYRKADGILADLGVSSHHFDDAARGFTFQQDAPLDMRMNTDSRLTAAQIVNQYSEEQLQCIFRQYGEIENAARLSKAIVAGRQNTFIANTTQLVNTVKPCMPRGAENKYSAKVFQALRIEVNKELENLKALLQQSVELLDEGGRLVVITYHSLEDRLVKNFFKNGLFEGEAPKDIYGNRSVPFKQRNNKVIVPTDEEIAKNSRARSAKLRIGERTMQ